MQSTSLRVASADAAEVQPGRTGRGTFDRPALSSPDVQGRRFVSPVLVAASAGAAFSFSAALAAADDFAGTRSERLVERVHDVRAVVHRDHAELVVRRTVFNGGPRHDQAVFHIELPSTAVATGLRTLGSLHGRPHWFAGELMEAEAAAAKYRELTGIGGYYPKDPALLSWRSQSLLALQVFPCPPAAEKSVEYTLELPTSYREGAFHVRLPALGTDRLLASVTARSASPRDRLLVDGAPIPANGEVRLVRDREIDLSLVPHDPPPLAGRLAVVPFADRRVLTRYEIEAAPKVSSVPRGAWVVVVIDGSRSVPSQGPEKAALDAYLSHFSDAKIEVLVFDREVHRRHGRFVSVAAARADLAGLEIEQKNGSHVDRALFEADRLLAKAPASAAKRILVVTDGLTRKQLTPERLRAGLRTSGAVAHIGILSDGGARLERDDEHLWSSAVRPSGGLIWKAHAPGDGRLDAEERAQLRKIYEEWARPLRVDRFKLFSPDIALTAAAGDENEDGVLDEGEGRALSFFADRPLSWLRAEGELWSTPVRTTLLPDPERKKLWAALVFGSELLDQLSEPEMMTLALLGGAVSPVTSYLAIEPGVRPSTEGLDASEGGMGFGSGFGRVRMGAASVGGRTAPLNRQQFLETLLRGEWRRCGGKPDTATISFETTLDEVAEVDPVRIATGADALLERCLAEAVWDIALPVQFDDEWTTWSVEV
jgi:hypothetical protein